MVIPPACLAGFPTNCRRATLGAVLLLAGCAKPEIVAQTPGSVEIACAGFTCTDPQAVADLAEKHCRQYGLDAQSNHLRMSESGNRWETFSCVNNTGAPIPSDGRPR